MKGRFLILFLVVLSLTLIIAIASIFIYYAENLEKGESNVPNPAAVYCTGLGYEYKIVDTEEGQTGY